jgi:hypothetical protein
MYKLRGRIIRFIFIFLVLLYYFETYSLPDVLASGISDTSNPFKVLITLFGVDNSTGYVLSIVSANNLTKFRLYNATEIDLQDVESRDGITQISISFQNMTSNNGNQFRVCNVLIEELEMECIKSYKTPNLKQESAGFTV